MEEAVVLRIGDYITLKNVRYNNLIELDDMIFCVHLKRQYSTALELKEFLSLNDIKDVKSIKDIDIARYFKALQLGFENETILNNRYLEKSVGRPVFFGDVIQLFHVKSKKYISIYPDKLALQERENLRVSLSSTGDNYSWIKIIPRFNIDKEGDAIRDNNEMYLTIAERAGEYIHSAHQIHDGKLREVNCSLEASSWKLNIFRSSLDRLETGRLLASDLVVINDPETRNKLSISVSEDGEPRVILAAVDDGATNSSSIWVIEKSIFTGNNAGVGGLGGNIKWKTEKIRLKHLNTGRYLSSVIVKESDPNKPSDVEEVIQNDAAAVAAINESFSLICTDDVADPNTLFGIQEIHSVSNYLSNAKPCQMYHKDFWIQRGEVNEDLSFSLTGSKDSSLAVSLIISRYDGMNIYKDNHHEDSGKIQEPLDEYTGLTILKYFRKYIGMTMIPTTDSINTLWPAADRDDVTFFDFLITKALIFSQGFSIYGENINLSVDKADPSLRTRRQTLYRDQNIIQVVLAIIDLLHPITEMSEKLASHNKKNGQLYTEDMLSAMHMGQSILTKCFTIIFYCIKNNFGNQMYVASDMRVLLIHLGGIELAGECVTEMLSTNMELQETKIGEDEINIFVNKLRSSKMNAMYLQLLQSCCSCQGDGVDANQCTIAKLLFADTNDIIIHIHGDYSKLTDGKWEYDELFIPKLLEAGASIKGDILLSKGLPQLALSWTTNSIDFSPLGLFGKLSVNVSELYGEESVFSITDKVASMRGGDNQSNKSSPMKQKLNEKNASSAQQKKAVADYFISQMFLGAEMCLDRNYVAMHRLDEMYSYEYLVTILRSKVSDQLKSAAIRLVMCLYVDRDPQAETSIPVLTRTYSDVSRPEVLLPYVDPPRRYQFALLQQILSDHVKDIAGKRWTTYSGHALRLLEIMMKFNFYGTNEKLNAIIQPLIKLMDRRSVGSLTVTREDGVKMDDSTGNSTTNECSAKEEDEPVGIVPWQVKTLIFMESIQTMLAVLALVLAAVAVTIYQTITGEPDSPGSPLFVWGIIVLIIFIFEVSIRGYCHTWVRGSFWTFLTNKFNQIDIVVISIDIIFLSMPSNENSGGKLAKIIRLVRMIRLLRILRAAKVIISIQAPVSVEWKLPVRYAKAPIRELDAMVLAINILSFSQRIIDDRNLSLLLKGFHRWESGEDKRAPSEIFEQVILDSRELSLSQNPDFDIIFLDTLMYLHSSLVQSSLALLMSNHSMRKTLLGNAKSVQLLVSLKRERQFKQISQMLQQLERNAETHELWGELQSEQDYAISKQTTDILKELTYMCKIKSTIIDFDDDYAPDTDIQNLYRNLGCFNICFKVFGLLDSVEEDENGELDEVGTNTRELCLQCSKLMYWFLLDNPANQELGYAELDFFIDSLQAKIDSHHMFKAIFHNNEKLMRLIPHSYLATMSEKICKDGKSPYYLYLFLNITNVGDKNIVENQYEIMKQLTSTGRLAKVSLYICPIASAEYNEKVQLMEPYLNGENNLNLDTISPLLAYHLLFVDVMASCTVGRLNITTVEAKVQSVFYFHDVIDSILHPGTILFAKIRLARFVFNAIIEVEMMIPGLEQDDVIWRLLASFAPYLQQCQQELRNIATFGLGAGYDRLAVEYSLVAIMIISGFFGRYFDPAFYKFSEKKESIVDPVTGAAIEVDAITSAKAINTKIYELYMDIYSIYEIKSTFLSTAHRRYIYDALEALNKSTSQPLPGSVEKWIDTKIDADGVTETVVDSSDIEEKRVVSKYHEFLNLLESDPETQKKTDNEGVAFISILESLPFIADDTESDLRYEGLISKLVGHIKQNLTIVNNEKRLPDEYVKTTIWIIKAFRTMVENKMGMTIYERDEDGGAEQDEAAAPVVNALNKCGVTTLCIDLISVGIDEVLHVECFKLSVALLFKEGGALEVQSIMNNYLINNNSELFFKQIKLSIQKLISWHKWHDVIIMEDGKEPGDVLPEGIIIIRYLQLMCEGHYLPNQDIMRDQPTNNSSYNVLDELVLYMNLLTRTPCRISTVASLAVSATILEVIQGPCVGNQSHFALSTELLEALNRVLRAKLSNDCIMSEEIELKKTGLDILQALLEGQLHPSVVYDRVLSVLHMDVILMMSSMNQGGKDTGEDAEKKEATEISEEEVLLQTESVVLLQMLSDYKPQLRDELGLSVDPSDIAKSGTASVEIVWHGVLQRRFFHVPDICADLSKSSMDKLVEEIDRSSAENKLIDFIARSHNLYREVKHQQVLREKKLSFFANPKLQNEMSWFTFVIAWLINIIFISYYTYDHTVDEAKLPTRIRTLTYALYVILIFLASFNLIEVVLIRLPVIYQSLEDCGESVTSIITSILIDVQFIYHVWYLIFAVLGLSVSDYYAPFLLLDIVVKNSTTRGVLEAVVNPYKQLMWTLILMLFLIYIFSFYMFWYYPREFSDDFSEAIGDSMCQTLFNCLLSSVGYGLRSGGGIADFWKTDMMYRLIFDMAFFLIIMIIMLNVVFGIIIDTFGSLRAEKMEKYHDTINKCFVCAIDKQIFDRASDQPNGFERHIRYDHRMWNYLYFIIFLWEQDKDDDDGLEQYVRRCVDAADITWFPLHKAICLDLAETPEQILAKQIKSKLESSSAVITNKIQHLQKDIVGTMEQIQKLFTSSYNPEHDNQSLIGKEMVITYDNNVASAVGDDVSIITEA